MKCPNKNTPEWQLLVSNFGEDKAYAIWLENGEETPSTNEIEALVKAEQSSANTKVSLIKSYNFLTDVKGNLMPSKYVEQFVDSLTKLVFDIQSEDKKLSIKNTFKKIEDELNTFYEFHNSIKKKEDLTTDTLDSGAFDTVKQNQLVASYYKHILDNKDQYFNSVTKKIESMGYKVERNSSKLKEQSEEKSVEDFQLETEEDYLSGEVVDKERGFNETDGNLYQDPFTKLSPIIKRFISFIPATEESVLGLETYVSGSKVYSTLLSLTSNGEYSYEEMLQVLKDNVKSKPYLQEVINLLNQSDKATKIAFAKHFRHTYQTSKTLQIDDSNNKIKGKVIETNRNSQVQLVKEQWLDNSKLSDIFHVLSDGLFLDTKFIDGEFTKQWNKIVESKYDTSEVQHWLDYIGIDISIETLDYLKSNSTQTELKLKWEELFNPKLKNAAFYQIYQYVKGINPETNIEEENPLANENFITRLANAETLFRDSNNVTDNYKDGKNRSRYAHILATWLVNRFYQIKNNKNNIIQSLSTLPFGQHSYYLGKLKTNDLFRKHFSVDLFDTSSLNDERKSFDEMSKREKLITQINLFTNRQTGTEGEKISVFMTPSKSDKSTLHTMTAVRYNVLSNSLDFKNKTFNTNDQEIIMNIVRGEYARIKDAQKKRNEGVNFKDIVGYNPFRFYNYEELNNIEQLWTLNEKGEREIKDIDEVEEIVWNVIKKNTFEQIEQLRTVLTKAGVIKDNTLQNVDTDYVNDIKKKGNVDYFLADYIINYNVAIANYNILFQADTAFASKKSVQQSVANMFKRLAKDVAPSSKMARFKNNYEFNNYKQIFLTDTFSRSLNIDQLTKLLGNKANAYNEIEGTDAQEVTTLEEHLDVLYYYARLTDEQYNKLKSKSKTDKEFTEDELDIILQPLKPVHVGNYVMQEYGAEVPVYIKTSSFPLVPQLVKGTEFEKLERQMRTNDIRRATFLTGAKLGAYKPIDIWNKQLDENGEVVEYDGKALTDGTINEDALKEAFRKDKDGNYIDKRFLILNRDNFGIQQDVPFDSEKTSILEGSQLSKLILHGLRGDSKTIKEFNDLHIGITNRAFQSVLDQMGFVENPDGTFTMRDMRKLRDMLITELKESASGYTENDVLALQLNNDLTDFEIPIWASAKSKQYEALLNSIINKKVLKTKLPGKSYVLGTEEGFKGKSPEINYIKEDKLVGTKYDPKTGLKPQRFGYVKGSERLEESEYKQLSDKSGWNKIVFPAQIFVAKGNYNGKQIIGYRIPTQDLNSMSAMEVVGYLPDYMGDLLIAPKDFTKQMGSDFDIDKIYTHRWYEDYKDNKYDIESLKKEYQRISELNQTKEFKDLLELKDNIKTGNYLAEMLNKKDFKLSDEEINEMVAAISDKYPTEEEYIAKQQNKLDKNKIVDIYWNTLTKPENLASILRPLDNGNLPEAVKVIKENQPEDKQYTLSPVTQVDNFENGNAGKFGVAATSLLSTFNSILLSTDTAISLDTKFKFNGKEVSVINNPNTLDGKDSKAAVISAFQSASVDNIKELLIKSINYNKHTHDAFSTLALLGLSDTYISYLLAQPSIKRYVSLVEDMNDSYSNPMSSAEKNSMILSRISNELIKQAEEFAKLNNTTPKLTEDDIKSAISNWNKDFSEKQLIKELKGDNEYDQLILLMKFIELSRVGKEINNIIRAITPATSGIGKDRLTSTNKEQRAEDAFATEEIIGIDVIVGTIEKDKINATTITGNGLEILRKSNLMYNKYFKINDVAADLTDLIKENRLSKKPLTEKEQSKVISFLRSYLFSSDLKLYQGKDVETYRKELFFGKESLANRWREFKKENPDHFLANRIRTRVSRSPKIPHTIEYKASIDDSVGDVKNTYELIEMLYSDIPQTQQLAKDTIAYAYLLGGNQDAISLVKFIPITYLNALGFGNEIHQQSNQVSLDIALEQYLQNNPHHALVVTENQANEYELFKAKGTDLDDLILSKNIIKLFPDFFPYLESVEDLPMYISYKDNRQWKIYKLFSEENLIYQEISRLGTYTFTETKFNQSELQTSLVETKKEEIKIEKPKNNEEISGKKELNNLESEDPLFSIIDKKVSQFDTKVKEKYFSDGNIQNVTNILNKIASSNHPLNTLAKSLSKYSSVMNTTIELVEDDGNNWAGQYIRQKNKIYIKGNVPYNGNGVEPTLIHEIIHALTVNELRFNKQSKTVQDLLKLYEYAKTQGIEAYGLKDEYEFVAELFTSASFINKLKDIPAVHTSKYKNFLQEFLDKILELFGINKTQSTLYEQAFAVASNIIDNQYNKMLLEKEFTDNDFEPSNDMLIFEEFNNIEIEEYIKKCK